MRLVFTIFILLSLVTTATAQEVKAKIIGQKQLATEQGKAITIQLTDLTVEETVVGNNDGGGNSGGGNNNGEDDGDTDNGESDGDDNEDDGDNDGNNNGNNGNGGHNGNEDDDGADKDDDGRDENDDNGNGGNNDNGNNDDDRDDEDDDDRDEDNDNGTNNGGGKNGDKDKKDDKDDKGKKDDKDDDRGNKDNKGGKDDKGDKGNKGDKGGGNGNKDNKGNGKGNSSGRQAYPAGYTLELFAGDNYTFTGTTVTPSAGFTGTLTVSVRVKNEKHASPTYSVKINVTPSATPPANKPPVITGQVALKTLADTPIQIKLSDLQVSDPDDKYPEGFTLTLHPGEKYTVTSTTIKPASGYAGTLIVPTTVNDGKNNSAVFELKITVSSAAAPPQNAAPEIIGQVPLAISMNQSVRIVLSHLLVTDPDSKFPDDFSLKVFAGSNYSLEGSTVQPRENYTGDLVVNVSVHDGVNESKPYPLKIAISTGTNQKPLITGQAGLKVLQGRPLEIKMSHLVVEDLDNKYPDDFTLSVAAGSNYSVSNHTITPNPSFLGTLTVGVSVHDGKTSSDQYNLTVQVIPSDKLEIIGQKPIEIGEDSSIAVSLSHLMVNDPTKTFPQGFSIQIGRGDNYEISNGIIKPSADFSGNLTVPITIRKGSVTSPSFGLLVVVHPVNDPPELLNVPTEPIAISGHGPWPLYTGAEVVDIDDDHLLFAEVGFEPGDFVSGRDELHHEGSENIHAVFDEMSGALFMVGRASLQEYRSLINSISYTFTGPSDSITHDSKKIYVKLNDGKDTSADVMRVLMFDTNASLEIPTAFTPNNDNANDTWRITPLEFGEQRSTFIRVYDKKGNLVFESSDLENEWDGAFNGSPLPADVYFYTIDMDLSYRKVSYKGIVAILR